MAARSSRPEVVRIGLFGSYARGDYAPGSDADVLMLIRNCDEPCWFLRPPAYSTSSLPVAVDLPVQTGEQARCLSEFSGRFRHILSEIVRLC